MNTPHGQQFSAGRWYTELCDKVFPVGVTPRRFAFAPVTAFCTLLNFAIPALAADCLQSKASATNGATFRDAPVASGSPLGTLVAGQTAPLVASIPRWYETKTPSSRTAFVSKLSTQIVPCSPEAGPGIASAGSFELHAIDVGTGLAIFVRGSDFTLLYDAGSNDDLARGQANRVVAYLKTLTPPITRIDHLLLSHPHRDHVELMPDVLRTLEVSNVWDSGAYNNICGYRHFLQAIVSEPGVRYRTAIRDAGNAPVELPAKKCYGDDEAAESISVPYQARIDDTPQALGANATMQILNADGSKRPSFNENSLVVRLDLGPHKVLLMGDAEAGGRQDPSVAPTTNSIEGKLLTCCAAALKANVLVAAHHGSKTSSRIQFLDAVGANIFVISSGPTRYATVTLPDDEVVAQFETRGQLFRTDIEDSDCVLSENKIGPDDDEKAGGCDNILLLLPMTGAITGEYRRDAD